MSKYAGQRRAARSRRASMLGWVAVAIALGLAAVTTVAVMTGPGSGSKGDEAKPSDVSTAAKEVDPRDACPDAARLGVPPAYLAAWGEAITDLDRSSACQPVRLVAVPGSVVALGKAPTIDAWIPEDTSWVSRTSASVWKGHQPRAIALARTPVVVASTDQLSEAVGGLPSLLTPQRLGPLARDTVTFADYGDAAAGSLRVAIPEPASSATGSLGFAALVQAATGTPLAAAPAYVNPTLTDLTTIRTEHRVVAVSPDDAAVLEQLDPARRNKANLVVTTEQAALAQMRAAPEPGLAVGYLGTDLSMSAVAIRPVGQDVVRDLAAFLSTPAGAEALTRAGLRPAKGSLRPAAEGAIDPQESPAAGAAATADQVSGLASLFAAMHQRISTLVLLDASGSMLQPLPGSDVSKIDLVRRAARDTLRVASPSARAGLMTFRSDAQDRPVIRTPVSIAANGQHTRMGLHSTVMSRAVEGLRVNGGTPLYNAVRDAYREALRSYDPTMLNQIVLLSDGSNEDARGSLTLPRLLATLRAEADPRRPVRIIAIGYGPDADMDALNQIVAATKGRASWLRTVEGYADAVQTALFAA